MALARTPNFRSQVSFNPYDYTFEPDAEGRMQILSNDKGCLQRVGRFRTATNALVAKGSKWNGLESILAATNARYRVGYSTNDAKYALALLVKQGILIARTAKIDGKKTYLFKPSVREAARFDEWMQEAKFV